MSRADGRRPELRTVPVAVLILVVASVVGGCLLASLSGCAQRPRAESLLLITLDTVRRDHLPVYGYDRDTAPALTGLAGEAAVFETAIAQETNTGPPTPRC